MSAPAKDASGAPSSPHQQPATSSPPATHSEQPPPATHSPEPTPSSEPPSSSKPDPSSTPSPSPSPTPSTSSEESTTSSSSSSSSSSTPESTPPPETTTTSDGTTITITSTLPLPTASSSDSAPPGSVTTSTDAAGLPSSTAVAGSSGLSTAGKISVAVVVPVVSVALIIIALLFWWRKRKARKAAEEERKQEIEEYRFNPNNDATLPTVGAAAAYEGERGMRDGGSGGYRGWGTTSNPRKLSTNLSSGGAGMTMSDTTSNPGYPRDVSPIDDTLRFDDGRPISGDSEMGALQPGMAGAGAAAGRPNQDIHRGPSNASSAYSAGNRSDVSDDIPMPGAPAGSQYYQESAYYDGGPQQGPYADGGYGGGQPVIRDVQARRNTRIENASVFPQQGNAGISQNF